jgi:hypothetical protein
MMMMLYHTSSHGIRCAIKVWPRPGRRVISRPEQHEPLRRLRGTQPTTYRSSITEPSYITSQDNLQAQLPNLRIAVVGAGIGGLATAVALRHAGFQRVTVFEQARVISEVGAGLQVAPNLARLLRRWGVLDSLEGDAIALARNSLRRYQDDSELGTSPFMYISRTFNHSDSRVLTGIHSQAKCRRRVWCATLGHPSRGSTATPSPTR